MTNAAKILNLIRLRGSNEYQNQVPALDNMDAIGKISGPILSQPMIYKEFTELFGAFIEMQVLKRTWNNPLAELIKTRQQPLGEYSAEVTANPINPKQYDPLHPEKLLEYSLDEDFVQYYARNVKEMFKITIAYEDLQGAFSSFSSFEDYVSMKITQLESGRQISSYNHVMEAIVANYKSGLFVNKGTMSAKATQDVVTDSVAQIKTIIDEFQFPSYKYNNYGNLAGAYGKFRGWTNFDDIYIIARADVINNYGVKWLAVAFNLSEAEIGKRIIKIPAFAYDNYDKDGTYINTVESNIALMICDRRMFQFSTDMQIDDSFYNPETLTRNYYKHWWATYGVSALANCAVFTTTTRKLIASQNRTNVWNNEPVDLTIVNNTETSQDFVVYWADGVQRVYDYASGTEYSSIAASKDFFTPTHSAFAKKYNPTSSTEVINLTDSKAIANLIYLILVNNDIWEVTDSDSEITNLDFETTTDTEIIDTLNNDSTKDLKFTRKNAKDYTKYINICDFMSDDGAYFKSGTTDKFYFTESAFYKTLAEYGDNIIYRLTLEFYEGTEVKDNTTLLMRSDVLFSLKEI